MEAKDREPYKDKDYVIELIEKDLAEQGLTHEKCYIGITNNWGTRKDDHNVKDEWAKTYMVLTKSVAKAVEKHFTHDIQNKMDGDTGGGKDDSWLVYVYQKSNTTREQTS